MKLDLPSANSYPHLHVICQRFIEKVGLQRTGTILLAGHSASVAWPYQLTHNVFVNAHAPAIVRFFCSDLVCLIRALNGFATPANLFIFSFINVSIAGDRAIAFSSIFEWSSRIGLLSGVGTFNKLYPWALPLPSLWEFTWLAFPMYFSIRNAKKHGNYLFNMWECIPAYLIRSLRLFHEQILVISD